MTARVIVGVPPRLVCGICGPCEHVHTICHDRETTMHGYTIRSLGCGHALEDHTNSLRCTVCGRECGIDCRPLSEKIVSRVVKPAQGLLL